MLFSVRTSWIPDPVLFAMSASADTRHMRWTASTKSIATNLWGVLIRPSRGAYIRHRRTRIGARKGTEAGRGRCNAMTLWLAALGLRATWSAPAPHRHLLYSESALAINLTTPSSPRRPPHLPQRRRRTSRNRGNPTLIFHDDCIVGVPQLPDDLVC